VALLLAGMRSKFVFLAAIVLVAPVAPAQAGLPQLAGSVVVSGSATATMRVHAARPFTFSGLSDINDPAQRPNPDIHIDGAGRAFGVVLTQNTRQRRHKRDAMDGATALLLRYGMCQGRGCAPIRKGLLHSWAIGPGIVERNGGSDTQYTFPAGDYDLTLLTDGAPVSARLTLHGLIGSTALRPKGPDHTRLTEALPVDPAGASYQADDRFRFTGLGLLLVTTLGRSDVHSQPEVSFCLRQGSAEPDPTTDEIDSEAACGDKTARSVIDDQTGDGTHHGPGFWGYQSANGTTAGGGLPAGRITAYASLDASAYRLTIRARPTPTDNSHTFLALWFPWR
jgi:hypothetical protein